jgi:DNA-binding transcriptional ArsR family regulator
MALPSPLTPVSYKHRLIFVRDHQAVLDALTVPTRRGIFERIAARPRSVTELANELPVSQPAVSQHLRVLRDAGLVRVRREGARRVYEADARGLEPLRQYIESFWTDVLEAFSRVPSEHPRAKGKEGK